LAHFLRNWREIKLCAAEKTLSHLNTKRGKNEKKDGERMKNSKLEKKLQELVAEFGGSADPRGEKLAQLAKQARNDNENLQKSMDRMQQSLDYLRVCIKYQIFDLEATRRENKYLRKLLEDSKD
jgi:hypothetical protein